VAVESESDRLSMLQDFGVTARIGSSQVTGILDRQFLPVDVLGHGVESSQPMFLCRTADLPAITRGTTTLTATGEDFVVVEVQPDGDGLTMLKLRI